MKYDIEYVILQNKYRKLHNNNLFPDEWYNIKNYKLKKEILKECLSKQCLIIESSKYSIFRKEALK